MEFETFGKISRLSREMVITEKIDGTNAVIGIATYGARMDEIKRWGVQPVFMTLDENRDVICVYAGSRNRWISTQDDNHGFAKWVVSHGDEILELGEGRHYGEWWGHGIQRGYGLSEKVFSLFNVSRWNDASVRPPCCSIVPTLYVGEFDTHIVTDVLNKLADVGSIAAPGFMNPEGVVIFHTASGHLYKKTIKNDNKPKSQT